MLKPNRSPGRPRRAPSSHPLTCATLAELSAVLNVSEPTLSSAHAAALRDGISPPAGPPYPVIAWWAWCCVEAPRAPLRPLREVLFDQTWRRDIEWSAAAGLVAEGLCELTVDPDRTADPGIRARRLEGLADFATWGGDILLRTAPDPVLAEWAATGSRFALDEQGERKTS